VHMCANMLRGGLPDKHRTDAECVCAGTSCKTCCLATELASRLAAGVAAASQGSGRAHTQAPLGCQGRSSPVTIRPAARRPREAGAPCRAAHGLLPHPQ